MYLRWSMRRELRDLEELIAAGAPRSVEETRSS
jgi:hypothetical protein